MTTLEDIKNLVARFSDESFGEQRPYTAPLYHLKKEADSASVTGEMEDFIDMQLLLLDAFRKRFPDVNTTMLLDSCKEKIEIIIPARSWKKTQYSR
jgi:hypothetical protein